ncbi:MAG: RDD family protein [Treponema sp.]|nr:RDD family protein [Treponema sp.]
MQQARYNVFFPKRYGGTPGKLIVGIKIIKIDSLPIGWKESFLRHSISMSFSILSTITTIIAISLADNEIYNNLSWLRQSAYLNSLLNYSIITRLVWMIIFN